MSRTPPHNLEAEESLLGAAMLAKEALEVLMTDVVPADFYKPGHILIAEAMGELYRRGDPVDPVTVAERLRAGGAHNLERVGGPAELVSLASNVPATSSARRYARIVSDMAILRRLVGVGAEITELGYETSDVLAAVDTAQALVGGIDLPVGTSAPAMTVNELMALDFKNDWVIPGLLERHDRLVLTAPEGFGKSTIIRQIAVQVASGIHPFKYRPIERRRCLIVDVENSPTQLQTEFRPLLDVAGHNLDPDCLRIEPRPEGIDLTTRHDSQWLLDKVASTRPDILFIGPIYKLHAKDPNEEMPARAVTAILDNLRVRFRCALVIEGHSPHAMGGHRPLRPVGSSLWMRWPEFGYGLTADREAPNTAAMVVPWRGPRGARDFPRRLERGHEWPWSDGTIDVERGVPVDDNF